MTFSYSQVNDTAVYQNSLIVFFKYLPYHILLHPQEVLGSCQMNSEGNPFSDIKFRASRHFLTNLCKIIEYAIQSHNK